MSHCWNCEEREADERFNDNGYCFDCQRAYERGYQWGQAAVQPQLNRLYAVVESKRRHHYEEQLIERLDIVRSELEEMAKRQAVSGAAIDGVLQKWFRDIEWDLDVYSRKVEDLGKLL